MKSLKPNVPCLQLLKDAIVYYVDPVYVQVGPQDTIFGEISPRVKEAHLVEPRLIGRNYQWAGNLTEWYVTLEEFAEIFDKKADIVCVTKRCCLSHIFNILSPSGIVVQGQAV